MKVKVTEVTVAPDRQRKIFDEDEIQSLALSFKLIGQLQPIVIHADRTLSCGERRLRAAKLLGWEEIEAVIFEELDPTRQELAQLEENIRRQDLTWQETSAAYSKIHEALKKQTPGWTVEQSADYTGVSHRTMTKYLQAHLMLRDHPDKVAHCTQMSQVIGVAERLRNRLVEKEIAKNEPAAALSVEALFEEPKPIVIEGTAVKAGEGLPTPIPEKPHEVIMCKPFHEWAAQYEGVPFNFLHCDFPYGINLQKSDQGGADDWGVYEDTPEIYWTLCKQLADNLDRVVAKSAHVMFWFSMTYYEQTRAFFEKLGFNVNPFPLVWVKSDGSGILPDPRRGPRRTVETALLMSRGDRFVVRSVADHYSAPATKKLHISEKPQPVLRHFFRMFVDETTDILDPTCGSGNALAVAYEMKAHRIVGMDINKEYVEYARGTVRKAKLYSKIEEVDLGL